MSHTFINEIEAGNTVKDIYLVKDPILRSTTRGDLYIAMYILDKTGQVNGRMWQATEATYQKLPKPGFVYIEGRSELYQNNLQIVVNRVEPVETDRVDLGDFLPRTDQDTAALFEEVKQMVSTIKHPQLKALVNAFVADEKLMNAFCNSPAAMKMHHSYLGGLLVHTHNMLRVGQSILPNYPKVQADLVLAGLFLHDMGKTEELACDIAFTYTDSGQLIGHISKTLLMVHRKAEKLRNAGTQIDEEVLDALGHIILSHHGQYEFGSPKLPATAEAFMVNYIDDLDAKMAQVTETIERENTDTNWTTWQHALQTRIYAKRLDEE